MQAVVGEVGTQATVLVGKQGIQVNPGNALTACHLLEEDVGLDDDVVTVLEQFPLAHVVVEGQQALQVDLGARAPLLDHDDEPLGHTGDAVGGDAV